MALLLLLRSIFSALFLYAGIVAAENQAKECPTKYSLGIDVGTGSARCGVFTLDGKMIASQKHDTQLHQPLGDFYEQSSQDIWDSISIATKAAMAEAGVSADDIVGIGFDATCSLVCEAEDGKPLSVDPHEPDSEWDVIVWLDHRAEAQAQRVNSQGHEALRTVGGVISPEMEMPKLMWLKESLPDRWERRGKVFDLSDYLVYRATGVDTRSLCTTVCKWNFDAMPDSNRGWDPSFLTSIGLEDLSEDQIGVAKDVSAMGEPVGEGLTERAAKDLGLKPGIPVGVGMIDAHAGGLGVLGATVEGENETDLEGRMALIAGTSCCHMFTSKEPVFAHGIWGPYNSAMIPDMFLNEGGQSTAGKLIGHVVTSHPAHGEALRLAKEQGLNLYDFLNGHLESHAESHGLGKRRVGELTRSIHVNPDYFGNRSPLADPQMRGAVVGLKLADDVHDLALQYLATVQALAYQTRHIIQVMEESGHSPIHSIFITGGLVTNPLYIQAHADATGCNVYLPSEEEAVLLGAAVLGARAGGAFESLPSAMAAMNRVGGKVSPMENEDLKAYHAKKYRVFRKMIEDQLEYRRIMQP